MINLLKQIFGIGPKVDYKQLLKEGAIIVDVRTKGEFAMGHIKGSINIPLDTLPPKSPQFKNKEKTIITCCASGMRSASARGILLNAGYKNVYNGGGWNSLNSKI